MTTACPRAPREKKKKTKKQQQQTNPHREDKKKKQHIKLGMNIRNVYILV